MGTITSGHRAARTRIENEMRAVFGRGSADVRRMVRAEIMRDGGSYQDATARLRTLVKRARKEGLSARDLGAMPEVRLAPSAPVETAAERTARKARRARLDSAVAKVRAAFGADMFSGCDATSVISAANVALNRAGAPAWNSPEYTDAVAARWEDRRIEMLEDAARMGARGKSGAEVIRSWE